MLLVLIDAVFVMSVDIVFLMSIDTVLLVPVGVVLLMLVDTVFVMSVDIVFLMSIDTVLLVPVGLVLLVLIDAVFVMSVDIVFLMPIDTALLIPCQYLLTQCCVCSNQRPQKKTEPTYWGLVARENGALEVSAVVCRLFQEPLWPVQGGRAWKPGMFLRRFFERKLCEVHKEYVQ